jgi:hypothetical protein
MRRELQYVTLALENTLFSATPGKMSIAILLVSRKIFYPSWDEMNPTILVENATLTYAATHEFVNTR